MRSKINFHAQDIDFELKHPDKYKEWIEKTIREEGKQLKSVIYIFVDDAALHQINVAHLDHDTLTDIITFPYGYDPIETEIYISIERVKENAVLHNEPFDRELKRVIIHGVLHMIGYGDKSKEEAQLMRRKEDHYIDLF